METSKILTASLLDLLFDNRNKDYGAYELRKTYQERIIKSLVLAISVAGLVYAGVALANSKFQHRERYNIKPIVELQQVIEKKEPEKLPDPPKHTEPPQVKAEIFTPPKIVATDDINKPLPTQEDLDSSKIGLVKMEGVAYNGSTDNTKINDNTGVIDDKPKDKDEGVVGDVQIEAKYQGDWKKFLERNLRAEVPVDNGAPAGRYTIIIQFIVDIDGTVSNITPLTHLGYGMEEEAIRVLKKADKWEPAFQKGIHVKAYRRQPITFEVLTED